MSSFRTYGSRLRLAQTVVGEGKLREAQFGALLALGAHASRSDEAAQIILPTGVGKTIVAVLSPYVLRARKVLVVVPGRLIAEQVKASFEHLDRLKEWEVLPHTTRVPRVKVAKKLAKEADWEKWESEADVVIGTPNVFSATRDGVDPMPRRLFDLVIFDEAHHLPATTWTGVYEATDARAVLLTATPFRNDRKRLPGEIAFAYPLKRAVERRVFGPVKYLPVEPEPGVDDDEVLAAAAIDRLDAPEHVQADSRLLVRTDRVEHADQLEAVYRGLGASLGVIDHRTSWKDAIAMRAKVEAGDLRGFVCVGSLTEGFDFPALKIAAYHSPHKTLGPTLQFIGRLSRVGEIEGELLAMRSAVTDETKGLYREDVAWRDLLPALVDSAVDREREIREYVTAAAITGRLNLPPLALTPPRMAHVFRTIQGPNLDAELTEVAGAEVVQRIEHDESRTLAFVTRRIERPRFLRLDTLDTPVHELHLVTWVEKHGVLFVATNTQPALKTILDEIAPGPRRSLTSLELRRLLAGASLERCFSVGTRALQAQSATSYRTAAGSKTEDDITPADALAWELGHAMGRSGDGTFGFSVKKSKVWEPGAADSLYGFRVWCEGHAKEITRTDAIRAGALDVLTIADALTEFPTRPIVGLWPQALLDSGDQVVLDDEIVAPERVALVPDAQASSATRVVFRLHVDHVERARIDVMSDGTLGGDDRAAVFPANGGAPVNMAEYLSAEPLRVFFADGSLVEGDRLSAPPPAAVPLAGDVRHPVAWDDTDITKEFGVAPAGLRNVATAAAQLLERETPIVIQDHLAGEIADFIGIKTGGLRPEVHLVHCKASGAKKPTARLGDVQELAAQSMRSTLWLVNGTALWSELLRRLRARKATKVIAGEDGAIEKLLHDWSQDPPLPYWHIWAVQPGVSDAELDAATEVTTLLTAAHKWCVGSHVEFRLVCSA
jgi:superfamily II DNA or RNA helicase